MKKLILIPLLTLAAWGQIALQLGPLRLGCSEASVLKGLGPPTSKTAPREEAATGSIVSDWNYPGLKLTMAKDAGAVHLQGFTLKAPCKLRSPEGVGIGSSEAELKRAYPQAKKSGSVYSWFDEKAYQIANFTLKGGKVVEISAYPGPE